MQQDDEDDDLWERMAAEQAADDQRKAEPAPALSGDDFLAWRSPRRPSVHAMRLDNRLWQWLVRTRWDGFNANNIYSGPSPFDAGPMWCFQRFGKSETVLHDGRVIHIAGEHEDSYDPDFYIYNDVTVIGTDGQIAIYGYPAEDFPPTDFHSATQIGDEIFIVGSLGYPDQRKVGETPVYALDVGSMRIRKVSTYGQSPGWIHEHSAKLAEDGMTLVIAGGDRWMGDPFPLVENIDEWALDSVTGEWRRLTKRDWAHWVTLRVDRERSRIRDVRSEWWNERHAHLGMKSYWHYEDAPDFGALEKLYRVDADAPPLVEGSDYNRYVVEIDGVKVRFRENSSWVEAIVEGQLEAERLQALQQETLATIERLEGTACEILDARSPPEEGSR